MTTQLDIFADALDPKRDAGIAPSKRLAARGYSIRRHTREDREALGIRSSVAMGMLIVRDSDGQRIAIMEAGEASAALDRGEFE